MKVFITSLGRTGTVTLSKACEFLTREFKISVGHETPIDILSCLPKPHKRNYKLVDHYPENHIEINPHLRCVLADLLAGITFAEKNKLIFITRGKEKHTNSLALLDNGEIVRSYKKLYPSLFSAKKFKYKDNLSYNFGLATAMRSIEEKQLLSFIDLAIRNNSALSKKILVTSIEDLTCSMSAWQHFCKFIEPSFYNDTIKKAWPILKTPLNTTEDRIRKANAKNTPSL